MITSATSLIFTAKGIEELYGQIDFAGERIASVNNAAAVGEDKVDVAAEYAETFKQKAMGIIDEVGWRRAMEDERVQAFSDRTTKTFTRIVQEVQRAESRAGGAARRILEILGRSYSVINQAISLFGAQLPAMLGATIQFIVSTAGTMIKIATAKLVSQDYAGAALTFASAGMTFAQQIIAEIERQRVQAETAALLAQGQSFEQQIRTTRISVRV